MCIEPNITLSTIGFVASFLGVLALFIKVSIAVWREANRPARYPGE
jgi:hypothetical protein